MAVASAQEGDVIDVTEGIEGTAPNHGLHAPSFKIHFGLFQNLHWGRNENHKQKTHTVSKRPPAKNKLTNQNQEPPMEYFSNSADA